MTVPARPAAMRRYGQNHLVDRGTLDAIVALTDVRADDVVLEVGAADGVLTRELLERAALVHAFEIDRRFVPQLEQLAGERPGLRVHSGDALKADLGALSPPPTLFAANLAYNIAIPIIVTSVHELPTLRRWAVMVQKELGERLFARPSTKAYSAVSVIVQLACRQAAARPVPRTVFSPRPRVDSLFLVFERLEPPAGSGRPEPALVERIVRAAFAQRRKMLANSLAGTPIPGTGALTPETVRRALGDAGLSGSARPEELAPERFVDLTQALIGPAGREGEHR
jgi:16S rRNA (adenine1518-N6/adenine1519-N6)-dimethyltransferase